MRQQASFESDDNTLGNFRVQIPQSATFAALSLSASRLPPQSLEYQQSICSRLKLWEMLYTCISFERCCKIPTSCRNSHLLAFDPGDPGIGGQASRFETAQPHSSYIQSDVTAKHTQHGIMSSGGSSAGGKEVLIDDPPTDGISAVCFAPGSDLLLASSWDSVRTTACLVLHKL